MSSCAIRCPECCTPRVKVIDSRWTGDMQHGTDGDARRWGKKSEFLNAVRRRRRCDNGHRFTTYEMPSGDMEEIRESNALTTATKKLLVLLLKDLAGVEANGAGDGR